MKTILVCNQKGGVGKTLIADEIAFSFDRTATPYNFYDLDGQGGSIHNKIENNNAEVTIVDTPGALQKNMIDWMREADIIIIPTKMTTRDIPPLETMIDLIKKNNIKAPVIYVLNCWNSYKASADFEEWFTEKYPNEKCMMIPQSEIFTQAAAEGVSVIEYKKNSKPAEKIRLLTGLIKYELGYRQ